MSYHRPRGRTEPAATPPDRPTGRVAMYAQGRDYHTVLRQRLDEERPKNRELRRHLKAFEQALNSNSEAEETL